MHMRSCWQCVQVGSTIYNSTKRKDCLTNNNNVHRQQLKTAALPPNFEAHQAILKRL